MESRRDFPMEPEEGRDFTKSISPPAIHIRPAGEPTLQKDELIQMHTLLCQIKNHLENTGVAAADHFREYDDLGVSPVHVHRSKGDHKRAIFLLGKELASFASSGELSGPALVSNRFAALADNRERVMARL
jgi:hypothetical protein